MLPQKQNKRRHATLNYTISKAMTILKGATHKKHCPTVLVSFLLWQKHLDKKMLLQLRAQMHVYQDSKVKMASTQSHSSHGPYNHKADRAWMPAAAQPGNGATHSGQIPTPINTI